MAVAPERCAGEKTLELALADRSEEEGAGAHLEGVVVARKSGRRITDHLHSTTYVVEESVHTSARYFYGSVAVPDQYSVTIQYTGTRFRRACKVTLLGT